MHISRPHREAAVAALTRRLSAPALRKLIPASMRRLVKEAEGLRPGRRTETAEELAHFLLDLYGTDLLAQTELREQLCLALDGDALLSLRDAAGLSAVTGSRRRIAAQVAGRKWYPGKWWARYFATAMGFPPVFAGLTAPASAPPYEDVEAYQRPPELHEYQKVLRDRVLELLQAPPSRNRAILSLPTGAGKTRIVVEALVTAMNRGMIERPYVLWIAQSDELCEQALDVFRQVWQAEGRPGDALRLYRLWGGRDLPDLEQGGVIVASIQKLYRTVQTDEEGEKELTALGRTLAVVVIDEAHHAIAPSYTRVLSAMGLDLSRRDGSPVPVLGLTATPYRSDSATERLSRRFHSNLLVPWPVDVNPVERLQRDGILARAVHEVIQTGREYTMTEVEARSLETFADFPDSFVRRIGADGVRNHAIVERLVEIDPSWPVLFFGCSVEHACAIAVHLRRSGIRAAVVTAGTSPAARRSIIEDFRTGRIQVLCNYGILTTGFDAPGVRVVVVARPTASSVLYEQMIGRGMRGPRNGGTDECLIIDFADNLERFGVQMAYTRFAEYWRNRPAARLSSGSGVTSVS